MKKLQIVGMSNIARQAAQFDAKAAAELKAKKALAVAPTSEEPVVVIEPANGDTTEGRVPTEGLATATSSEGASEAGEKINRARSAVEEMAPPSVRFLMKIEKGLDDRLEVYRAKHGLRSRAQTIRALLEKGLK